MTHKYHVQTAYLLLHRLHPRPVFLSPRHLLATSAATTAAWLVLAESEHT